MLGRASLLRLATAGLYSTAHAIYVDVNDQRSVANASYLIANAFLRNWYTQNGSDPTQVGIFDNISWEWWQSGGAWTALQDYRAYTGDQRYLNMTIAAIRQQANPGVWDFKPGWEVFSEANDDQAYWTYNALNAFEYGLPAVMCPAGTSGPTCPSAYVNMADNVFNQYVSRWNATTCGGGLKWQYYPSVGGFYYKNTVSNGGFFQVAARLARYTGNQTYLDWANTVWDWTANVGFLNTASWQVYDGAGDNDGANCTALDPDQWSYNIGSYMMGAAIMSNYTGNSVWLDRVTGLVNNAIATFTNAPNAQGVLYEQICEASNSCTFDALSFKGYLASWLGKTSVLVPSLSDTIMPILRTSAQAAAQACIGPLNNITCGTQWFVAGGDGSASMPQQMAALQTVQSVLVGNAPRFNSLVTS